MTSEQVSTINGWIRELEVAWLEFPTPGEAVAFEREVLSPDPPIGDGVRRAVKVQMPIVR